MALIIILRELIASSDIARCIFEFSRFARVDIEWHRAIIEIVVYLLCIY
jgi:hypothetical protein